jgi:nitronate monooxygenase
VARWPATRITALLRLRHPLIQAPMAGSTPPELVAAVSQAGALGSLGAARMAPDELRAAIRAVRALTDKPFAVNLFAPLTPGEVDAGAVARVREALAPWRGGAPGELPGPPPFGYDDQVDVVVAERVPVFSFALGIPDLEPLRAIGAVTMGTATTVQEALALERAGVDAVVAQGFEAGGHRGTFAGDMDRSLIGLMALVPQMVDAVSVPVVAAGAIMDGRGVAATLALGADAAQLGTAFLACPESSADEAWKRALAQTADDGTLISHAATGRVARMVRTEPVEAMVALGEPYAPFPLQAALLAEAGVRPWLAGQGAGMARSLGAAELVAALVEETERALAP